MAESPPAVIMSNVLLIYCDCVIVVSVMDYCEWATQLGCKDIQYLWRDDNKKRMMVDLLGSYELLGCYT